MTPLEKEFIELTAAIYKRSTYGCGNFNCRVLKPKGQYTNGTCHCFRYLADDALQLAVVCEQLKKSPIRPDSEAIRDYIAS